ncbi:MAG TPA: hypothetical protein PLA87_20580, partial [Pseudomonadota bacterium]|nr:hypothetical protein [Pseudomonadota bacterium]
MSHTPALRRSLPASSPRAAARPRLRSLLQPPQPKPATPSATGASRLLVTLLPLLWAGLLAMAVASI